MRRDGGKREKRSSQDPEVSYGHFPALCGKGKAVVRVQSRFEGPSGLWMPGAAGPWRVSVQTLHFHWLKMVDWNPRKPSMV